jgi:hypothetical protein
MKESCGSVAARTHFYLRTNGSATFGAAFLPLLRCVPFLLRRSARSGTFWLVRFVLPLRTLPNKLLLHLLRSLFSLHWPLPSSFYTNAAVQLSYNLLLFASVHSPLRLWLM